MSDRERELEAEVEKLRRPARNWEAFVGSIEGINAADKAFEITDSKTDAFIEVYKKKREEIKRLRELLTRAARMIRREADIDFTLLAEINAALGEKTG